jgi:hypothetical protein
MAKFGIHYLSPMSNVYCIAPPVSILSVITRLTLFAKSSDQIAHALDIIRSDETRDLFDRADHVVSCRTMVRDSEAPAYDPLGTYKR